MFSFGAYLSFLLQVAEHDNDPALCLPGHVPEFSHRAFHGSLCGKKCLATFIALPNTQSKKLIIIVMITWSFSSIAYIDFTSIDVVSLSSI